MNSKHTPGPWETLAEECDKPYIRVRGTALGGRYKIANVLTPVYEGVHAREAQETRANARLIAAAPELLEMLRKAVRFGGLFPDLAEEAQAAIVKATGDQS